MIGNTMVVKPGLTGTATMQDGESVMRLKGQDDRDRPMDVTLKETTLKVMLKLLEEKNDSSV